MSKLIKTYHIITIGCQMNKADSERIASYLDGLGLKEVKDRKEADLVILTTCGVRQSAEDRVYGLIPKIKRENQKTKIILTGCLAKRKDVQKKLSKKVDIWLPITELTNLNEKLNKKSSKFSGSLSYLEIPAKYRSSFSAFVPIGNGCNNFCTYCVVPYARGRETYRPTGKIIAEVKKLVKNNYKEITLIAQNVNSYQYRKISFPTLLSRVAEIKGDFWIRFATSHPKDMSDKLIKVIADNPKICRHIHLPAQSGDDKILTAMNRNYTQKHYLSLIEKIRKSIPGASITTDIIVGFPGETRSQFNNTIKLFKLVKFDMAYIARYSPRPGTMASQLEDNVSPKEKKKREQELMKILRKTALANNKKYLGKTVKVLVEDKNKKNEWFGKTDTYKTVKFKAPNKQNLRGQFVFVKITNVQDFGLAGEIYS